MHLKTPTRPTGWLVAAALEVIGVLLLIQFSTLAALADSPHIRSEVDTARCAACHSTHVASNSMLFRRVSPDVTTADLCLGCHGGGNLEGANIASGSIDSFALSSGHSLVEATAGGAKIEGCATCHDTHGASEDGRMLPAESINGRAVTSAGPQLCLACHDADDSWYGSGYPSTAAPTRNAAGYPVSGAWPGPVAYASSGNAHRLLPETTISVDAGSPQPREQGDCRYCHASHRGSNLYDSLLSTFTVPTDATLVADKTDGSYADLCFKCHNGVKPSGFATAPVDIERFATSGSASAGHSIVTSGGLLPVGSPLPCFECHNPHGSKRNNGSLISDERGGSLETSTLAGVREFCFTCHTTADTTAGWDSEAATYTRVLDTDKVVGIVRDGGVLHLSDEGAHAQSDSASCYDCHGESYSIGGRNVHDPASGAAVLVADTLAPITTADLSGASAGVVSLVATDTGMGVAVTYFALDGGDLNVGTQVLAAVEGTHTVQYWSSDTASNVEATNTAVFNVDRTAPVTTSDAVVSYAGTATIALTATDEDGGSGVASTWYCLDGGMETTGSLVSTSALGDHVVEFWSVDNAGNIESKRTTVFTVSGTGELSLLEPFTVRPVLTEVSPSRAGPAYFALVGRQPPSGFARWDALPARAGTG